VVTAGAIDARSSTATRSFDAIGTTATVVVTEPSRIDEAHALLQEDIDALDRACSRFRADSELSYLQENAGRSVQVTPLLFDALAVALSVARRTDGAVDPTVGNALCSLGYDRDFDQIEDRPLRRTALAPAPGFRHLHLNREHRTARIPVGMGLDLGSSAKAFLADRAAVRIASALQSGVLVSLGGDVAVAGPPPEGGWPIGIAVESAAAPEDVQQVVAIFGGGLASSSTETRTWAMGNVDVHHIVDPRTGHPAERYWRLASASGATCVDANALSTAAIVWGRSARTRVGAFKQPARLMNAEGEVLTFGGWPRSVVA
jgi:thiamine biosynthesis lipoprotein